MIRVQITQNIDAKAASVIGPEGGTLAVNDPESSLYGAKIELGPGALSESKVVSISETDLSTTLDEDTVDAGPFIRLGPSGTQFFTPVHVTVPYEDRDGDGIIDYTEAPETDIKVLYHAESGTVWEELPKYNQDTVNKTVTVEVSHFSDIVTQAVSSCNDPLFVFAIDGIKLEELKKALTFGIAGHPDDLDPSDLRKGIVAMGLLNSKSCAVAYSGSDNFRLRWDGNPFNTENIVDDLRDNLKKYYDKATHKHKKFAIVTHSWGTVLGMFALKYNYNVNPDIFITLSSPYGTRNADSHDSLYENLLYSFVLDKANDTTDKLGNWTRKINEFPFRWVNYWADNDIISGRIDEATENFRVDYSGNSIRGANLKWHYITTVNRDKMKYNQLSNKEKDRADNLIDKVRLELATPYLVGTWNGLWSSTIPSILPLGSRVEITEIKDGRIKGVYYWGSNSQVSSGSQAFDTDLTEKSGNLTFSWADPRPFVFTLSKGKLKGYTPWWDCSVTMTKDLK